VELNKEGCKSGPFSRSQQALNNYMIFNPLKWTPPQNLGQSNTIKKTGPILNTSGK
jgi:hypothetical protein